MTKPPQEWLGDMKTAAKIVGMLHDHLRDRLDQAQRLRVGYWLIERRATNLVAVTRDGDET